MMHPVTIRMTGGVQRDEKKIILSFYCSIAFFFIFFQTSCLSKNAMGYFTLINNTNELITHATIEISEQVFKINGIKPHEEFKGTFKIKGDSHYKVVISFASGKELSDDFGYVTHGFDFRHTIIVTDSSIFIGDTKVE